jgi:HlyD family secretion protein
MNLHNLIFSGKTLALLMVAAGVAGFFYYQRHHQVTPESLYRTEAVGRGDMVQTVSANGTLNPVTLVSVGTQVSGTVRKLHTDFNQKVKQGQILLELDDSLYAAQVLQSEANIRNVEAQLELTRANETRMQSLFAQEYVARLELDQAVQARKSAEAQIAQAQAQLSKDRVNLGYTIIRSPVSGVVVARQVDVGQTVAASFQTPELFKIAQDLSKMQIHSSFAEADVGQIRVGQAASFTVDAFPARKFKAVVYEVRLNPTIQQNVVTYDVVLNVGNPDQTLLPGMTAYVSITLAEKQDVLRVPNTSLRYHPADQVAPKSAEPQHRKKESATRTLYVLRDGKPVAVPVDLGITDNRYTEVMSGALHPGDQVVVGDMLPQADKNTPGAPRVRLF